MTPPEAVPLLVCDLPDGRFGLPWCHPGQCRHKLLMTCCLELTVACHS